MAQKPPSKADELLERLRASLDEDADNSPEEVFAGQSTGNAAADEDDFDANMARLLGSLVAEHTQKNVKDAPERDEAEPVTLPEDEELSDFEEADEEAGEAHETLSVGETSEVGTADAADGADARVTVGTPGIFEESELSRMAEPSGTSGFDGGAVMPDMPDDELPQCARAEVELDGHLASEPLSDAGEATDVADETGMADVADANGTEETLAPDALGTQEALKTQIAAASDKVATPESGDTFRAVNVAGSADAIIMDDDLASEDPSVSATPELTVSAEIVPPTVGHENEIVLDEFEEAPPVPVTPVKPAPAEPAVPAVGNGGEIPQEAAAGQSHHANGAVSNVSGVASQVPGVTSPGASPRAEDAGRHGESTQGTVPTAHPAPPAETAQASASSPAETVEAQQPPKAPPVTPVSSPLDALRRANAEKEKEEKKGVRKQSPLDALARAGGGIAGNVTTVDGSPLSRPSGASSKRERAMSDEDVELLLDLGYENNLAQKLGNERVEGVKYRRRDDEKRRRLLRAVYGCRGEEYGGHAQDKQIREDYRRATRGAIWRVVAEIFLTLLLLTVDLYSLMRDRLPQNLLPQIDAFVYPIGFLLLVVAAIPAWKLLAQGGRALLRLEPTPGSVPTLGYFLSLAYDILLLLSGGGTQSIWLNATAGMSLLLLSVGELMTIRRERVSFEVVAARSRKIVVEHTEPKKKKVVRGGHIVKIINDSADEKLLRVRPTDTVSGYFRRTGEPTVRYRMLGVLISLGLLLGGAAAGVSLIRWGNGINAVASFVLTAQVAMPTAALIGYSLPMLHATLHLKDHGCALIGQSAVDEYAGKKTLLFDDTEMFRAKSSTEITVKGSGDPRRYIRYAKRLFHTLGGTLRGVATSDLSEETYAERVEILKIADEGVEARIDGKVHVIAGNSAYLLKNGIAVPGENAELLVRRNVESCILYLAFDGKLRLGYEIDYRISGRFEQIVERLAALETSVAICSYDPDINPDFLARSRQGARTPVGVIKPIRFERQAESHLIDSGVVATRSARDIYFALAACDYLRDNDRQIRLFHGISLVLGAALAIGLSFAGWIAPGISMVALLLQIEWCLPIGLLTRRNLSLAWRQNDTSGRSSGTAGTAGTAEK